MAKITTTLDNANDVLDYSSKSNFPSTGDSGKIYIDKSTNTIYRWDGSSYVVVGSGNPIIKCYDTGTSDTAGTWTVSIPEITELTEGLSIKIRLKTSYNTSGNTLNVNGLGAKTIYWRYGSKLTSHYAKESVLDLTYTESAISSGTDTSGWIVENVYDSTNVQQLRNYYTRFAAKSSLYRYMICFVNQSNELIPANGTSNSTATTKTLTTESFDLGKGIYYYNSTSTISAGSLPGTNTLYKQLGLIDLRYSFNTGTTLTANKPIYLVVSPQSDGQVKLSSAPIVQSLPPSSTPFWFVFLGNAYDTYRIELVTEHPIYVYGSNGLMEITSHVYKSLSTIPTKVSDLENDSGFTTNTGTVTSVAVKMNGSTKGTITSSGTIDLGTVITSHQDISGKANSNEVVKLTEDQTVSGVKTFNAPTNSSGTEQATMKIKTANGGSITFGKEGNNSGSMIRLDQVDGTCRLRFRSSATAGAMVWEQPESGSAVYMDVNTVNFRNTSAVVFNKFKSAGYLYTDSSGNLKKGTMPTIPTKVSELTNDSGFTTNTGTVTSVAVKMNGSTKGTITSSGTIDLGTVITSHQDISGKQDKLVSGTNIKTINGNSILGSGDLTISGGSGDISVATNTTLGGIKPWRSSAYHSMYNNGTDVPVPDNTSRNINAISTTSGRYYAIETDPDGRAYVNVPWTNTIYSNVATMAGSTGNGSSDSYAYSTLTNNSSTSYKLKIFCRRITDAFNSTSSKSITFTGVSFTRVPYVAIGVYGTNSYVTNNVNVFDVTTSGCSYRATSTSGAAGSAFYIIAIQPY